MKKWLKTSNIHVYTIYSNQGFPNTLVHFVSAVIDRTKLGQHTLNTISFFFFFLHLLWPEIRCKNNDVQITFNRNLAIIYQVFVEAWNCLTCQTYTQ